MAEDVAQSVDVVLLLVVPGTCWCWYFLSRYVLPLSRRVNERRVNRGPKGHDAGHTSLYENNKVNNTVGFLLHSVRFFWFLRCELYSEE